MSCQSHFFLLFHDFNLSLLDFISPLYFTPKKHCHKTMPILWYKIISYLILIHQPVFCKFMWKIMHFLIGWGRSKLSKYYVPNCKTRCPFFASKYHFCRFICTNYIPFLNWEHSKTPKNYASNFQYGVHFTRHMLYAMTLCLSFQNLLLSLHLPFQ